MKLFLTVSAILFCFFFSKAKAQQNISYGSINGSIIDTISHNLSFAAISLLDVKDSSVVRRALSDTSGKFSFSKIPFGLYVLRVSYQGFNVFDKEVGVSQAHPNDSLPPITLQESVDDLGTVIVTAVIPVKMNGDTTEYNADAFGVKPNAVVEDLLKKLPGVEVDEDGNITAQGEKVARIFVDGKRFFGNDPKMATQNLPTEVVEKIQVFDGKTDQSEFTGFDDGNSIKTINIVTKKNKRKGWFGKSSAAVGNDEASLNDLFYDTHARVFRFMGDRRIAFVGAFNRTFKQPFAVNIGEGQNGLSKKISGAINYRDQFGKKTDFSGSYSYDNSNNISASQSYTQRLFQNDTTQNTTQLRTSNNSSQNHSINLNWDTKFDTLNELRVRADINFSNGDNSGTSNSFIDNTVNNTDSTAVSKTFAKNSRENNSGNASVSTTFRHRFFKPGRTISISNNLSSNSGNASGLNYSDIFSYLNDSTKYTNQLFNAHNNSRSINTTLAYTEPIALHQLIQFEINNSFSKNTSDRRTYNFDSTTMQYTLADSILTNKYENTYQSNRATLSYLYNNGVINFSAGTGVQLGNRESDNLSKNLFLTQHYVNLYPTVSFSYQISQYKRFRFNYHGRTNQPNVQQLQPVIDNSNPLNIVSGNPNLKQEFNNTFLLRYTNINKETNNTFFAMLNGSFTKNNIVNSITRLSNGGQSSIPVNLNGNYSLSGYVNWGFSIASPKSNIELSTRASNGRIASLIDGNRNYTYNTNFSQTVRWSTNLKETFDVNLSTDPSYHITTYTVNKAQNGNYYSQSISFDGTWYSNSGWEAMSKFNYIFYAGLPAGQNTSIPRWNISIAKLFFKNNSGEIKLTVNDLLNKSKGISFTRTENFIRQSQTNVLRRYFMLTFTYNLRKFGGKKGRGDMNFNRERHRNGSGFEGSGKSGGHHGGGF